jgi:hypothetical protein
MGPKGLVVRTKDGLVVGAFNTLFDSVTLFPSTEDFRHIVDEYMSNGILNSSSDGEILPFKKAKFSDIIFDLSVRGYALTDDVDLLNIPVDINPKKMEVPMSGWTDDGFVVRAKDNQIVGSFRISQGKVSYADISNDFRDALHEVSRTGYWNSSNESFGLIFSIDKFDAASPEDTLPNVMDTLIQKGYYLLPSWIFSQGVRTLKT